MLLPPDSYVPTQPEHFIGSARTYALMARQLVAESIAARGKPIKLLINGKPGIGKSALVRFLLRELQCHESWSTTKLNGTELKIERLDDIAASLRTTSLFGWRAVWIDEVDAILKNTTVQTRILTVLDDLPPFNAILCTSNCRLDDFEKRFQSRFRPFEVEPPTTAEIAAFLRQWIDPVNAQMIADGCRGDVRMALNDAQNALTANAMQQAA